MVVELAGAQKSLKLAVCLLAGCRKARLNKLAMVLTCGCSETRLARTPTQRSDSSQMTNNVVQVRDDFKILHRELLRNLLEHRLNGHAEENRTTTRYRESPSGAQRSQRSAQRPQSGHFGVA